MLTHSSTAQLPEVLSFWRVHQKACDNLSESFLHYSVIFRKQLQVQESPVTGAIHATAFSRPLTLWLLRTLPLPQWFPFSLFINFPSFWSQCSPFRIMWHLIVSHAIFFVNALLRLSCESHLWLLSARGIQFPQFPLFYHCEFLS